MVSSFIDLQRKENLSLQTAFLMVHILDRLLGKRPREYCLRLLKATILKIAVAYESDASYRIPSVWTGSTDRFQKKEVEVLKVLDYSLGWPGPLFFLDALCEALPEPLLDRASPGFKELATYFLEISLFDEKLVQVLPSIVAAAAYSLAIVLTGAKYSVRYHMTLVAGHGLTEQDTKNRAGVQTHLQRDSSSRTFHAKLF